MNGVADVIVVGAGLSGLKAADVLVRAGKRVIVLEARNRIGGRIMKGELCGRAIDHGAQWVSPKHTRVLAEARRFHMETYLQFSEGRNILSLNGQRSEYAGDVPKMPVLAMTELAMLQRRWDKEAKSLPEGTPWTAKHARSWDAQTLESWIATNLSTKASRGFARLLIKNVFGAHASEISYLWLLDMVRGSGGLAHLMSVQSGILDAKFKGSAFALAQHLANGLSVELSTNVEGIESGGERVRVKTSKGEYGAAHIVVAVPPALCVHINFADGLSPERRALHQRIPMNGVIKFHVAYETPFWRRNGYTGQVASDELSLNAIMEDTLDTGPAMLIGSAHGKQARMLSAMNADARRTTVMECLEALFGPEAHNAIGFAEKEWRSGFGSTGPGVLTQCGEALRAPCGRIHWASSETAVSGNGYMEGALESGERAANEILALT